MVAQPGTLAYAFLASSAYGLHDGQEGKSRQAYCHPVFSRKASCGVTIAIYYWKSRSNAHNVAHSTRPLNEINKRTL